MKITLKDIEAGPEQLDQKLLQLGNPLVRPTDKALMYMDLIRKLELKWHKKEKETSPEHAFCLAYLNQQTARFAEGNDGRKAYMVGALDHFRDFINGRIEGELLFYSMLSVGILLRAIGEPWVDAEEMFLKAYEIRPKRGESTRIIAEHYVSIKDWPVAYIFSRFAVDQYYGRQPVNDKWGVDSAFYAWKVLDLHTAICFSLGKANEAAEAYFLLYGLTKDNEGLFNHEDLARIQGHRGLFQNNDVV